MARHGLYTVRVGRTRWSGRVRHARRCKEELKKTKGLRLIPSVWSRRRQLLANQPEGEIAISAGLAVCSMRPGFRSRTAWALLVGSLACSWARPCGRSAVLQDQPRFLDRGVVGRARCGPCDGFRIRSNAGSNQKSSGPGVSKPAGNRRRRKRCPSCWSVPREGSTGLCGAVFQGRSNAGW